MAHTLSILVPCYNEESTLASCIEQVLAVEDSQLQLEILIIDDCSSDKSVEVAEALIVKHPQIRLLRHEVNRGKGAALHTGIREATGEFLAIQDADLEYNPLELKTLVQPLIEDRADVVFGSRYLKGNEGRVLYFWHTLMNKGLTLFSNMFTDLGLTDMETCYKIFKTPLVQSLDLVEERFGFEPEVVAKVSRAGWRAYEIGISYHGRTFEEGKKIGWKDGIRALYCIMHYGAATAPLPMQFMIYFLIGSTAALFNLAIFGAMTYGEAFSVNIAVTAAYLAAALLNYWLCILILFRHNARWGSALEFLIYGAVVVFGLGIDVFATQALIQFDTPSLLAKGLASVVLFVANFWMRKMFVFPEKQSITPPSQE